ncbi:MAG TPA: hypothetical protein VGI46_14580 [Candidatus Acidoferrum sp.]|jgi:hypothetical protein
MTTQPAEAYKLNPGMEPLCSRDNKVMRYEASGLPSGTDNRPSYHCGHEGCAVRYDLAHGYHTLIGMPDRVNPLEEPGVNTLKCERHGTWLYRRRDRAGESGAAWCCGVEGCDSCTQLETKGSWVRT